MKVLVAEDEPFLRDSYAEVLQEAGFDFFTAEDGQLAIEILNEQKPDIALLDIMMGKVDGYGVLQHIRTTPELAHIPVMMLTNLGDQDSMQKAFKMGADDYIIKSDIELDDIVRKVNDLSVKGHQKKVLDPNTGQVVSLADTPTSESDETSFQTAA